MPFSKPKIKQILFATDLSENANRAFTYATSLADAYSAVVTVLHVVEKMPPNAEILISAFLGYRDLEEYRGKTEAELIERIKTRIEHFCSEAADKITECTFILQKVVVEPGIASKRILHHAATGTYDALVMGCRGHGIIQEALFGGTTHKVLRECKIPVLLVPLQLHGKEENPSA
ncbi:MAG: universal stress protein [Desulfobacterales bacterium]|jgi:nucleotide-binding universal stress UspA family protein|nr:universal stress protein [Desulfobacterales bacterium]